MPTSPASRRALVLPPRPSFRCRPAAKDGSVRDVVLMPEHEEHTMDVEMEYVSGYRHKEVLDDGKMTLDRAQQANLFSVLQQEKGSNLLVGDRVQNDVAAAIAALVTPSSSSASKVKCLVGEGGAPKEEPQQQKEEDDDDDEDVGSAGGNSGLLELLQGCAAAAPAKAPPGAKGALPAAAASATAATPKQPRAQNMPPALGVARAVKQAKAPPAAERTPSRKGSKASVSGGSVTRVVREVKAMIEKGNRNLSEWLVLERDTLAFEKDKARLEGWDGRAWAVDFVSVGPPDRGWP